MSDQGFTFHATWERPCMGRFALHRPSQSSAVSTRCHAMTWRDLPGRVHLTVARVPTRNAHESRVALTTLRSEVRAGVYGSATGPQLAVSSLPGACLFQPGQEQPRARCEHAPVEPGFLCAAPAGTVHGSPSGSGHDVEVLGPDHVQGVGEASGGSLTQSLRRSASLTFKPAIRVFAFLPAAGNPSGTSEPALKPQEQIGFLGPQTLRAGHLSGDSSTATATPPSTATTPPVPGAATGWGITANAICQRPDLSPVMGTTSARQGLGCL